MSEKTTFRDQRRALAFCILMALLLIGITIGAWVFSSMRQKWAVAQVIGYSTSAAVPTSPTWVASSAPVAPIASSGSGLTVTAGTVLYFITESPIQYDYELGEDLEPISGDPPGPEWLRDWLGIDFLSTVRGAKLTNPTDEAARPLAALGGLRTLALSGAVSQEVLNQLHHLPALERLSIGGAELLVDEQLAQLPALPRLRILSLENCRMISDQGLDQIARIGALRKLTLVGNEQITNAGLEKLSRLAHLERLSLSFNDHSSDAVLEKLAGLRQLRYLWLDYRPGDVSTGLKYLDRFASLTELLIDDVESVTDESLAELPESPKLETLTLIGCKQLHAAGMANLGRLSNLKSLAIEGMTWLDDECIEYLKQLPKLSELSINATGTDLTDDGLAQLGELKQLKKLTIVANGYDAFSFEAIDTLTKSLPSCQIEYRSDSPSMPSSLPPATPAP